MSFRQKFQIDRLEKWRKERLSRFFHQEPRGVATGLHESLPSFIQRLAQRHAVPNGSFFLQEIHPDPVPSSGSLLGRHSRCLLVGKGSAEQVARKVARECSETQVLRLIQGPLSERIALFRDLRPLVAWCPSCLSEWLDQEQEIYRPLLWSIKSVKVCPHHRVALRERCPHCSTAFYHFGAVSWSTECSACGKNLADGEHTHKCTEFETFAATAIEDLLNWGWKCQDADFPHGQFIRNVDQVTAAVGGEYVLSSITGMTRAAIHAWRTEEERRPSLQALVHLSYCFDKPIHAWVTDAFTAGMFESIKPQTIPATALNQRHPSLEVVCRSILATLDDPAATPCSLSEMARQLNTSSFRLYRDCPGLAARVVARYAKYRNEQKAKRQQAREDAVRKAIHDVAESGASVSRHAVIQLLRDRGVKSAWVLKEIFTEQMQNASNPPVERPQSKIGTLTPA